MNNKQIFDSLYIHLPFCKQKCSYCDFASFANKEDLINDYIEALIKELTGMSDKYSFSWESIYFGGGTPTLLGTNYFEKIIKTLVSTFPLSANFDISNSEISMEANPGTTTKTSLKALKRLGINRLSIGAQSFNDKHLKMLGRIHDSSQIKKSFEDARIAGFKNINLDLIFALPNQTLPEWQKDLSEALELNPEHVSAYNLQIEEKTPLWDKVKDKEVLPATQELDAEMYEHVISLLTSSGYKHYEISNFAKITPDKIFECRHNKNYWLNKNYIGVGSSASSHINGKRWTNTKQIEEYIKDPSPSIAPPAKKGSESIFMGLRLIDGIGIKNFESYKEELEELMSEGLLKESSGKIKLTKKGLFLGNTVFEKFV